MTGVLVFSGASQGTVNVPCELVAYQLRKVIAKLGFGLQTILLANCLLPPWDSAKAIRSRVGQFPLATLLKF